ncbi:hypothetical protein J3R83DRAFT_9194 [Lanmaoa asiatica]|nr:hypothetical protein J3R83DRAFT_9194 [Lanmaoa asiatica]
MPMSFAADKTMVPEVTDMEIGGSKPSTEDSDTTWQIVDADKNAPMLSKQDSCTVGDLANDSTSTWDFNPNPVDPTTIENGGINTIPMNGVGRDDTATTTVNSNDNLDVIISSSKVLPSTGPSAGINIVSTVLSETSKEKLTGTVVTDENKKVSSTVKSDQDHSRTEETRKEPLTGGANQAGGSDENPGGDQEPLQKERPKPTQKKSVRLLLKNPISVASLAAAKVDMPELPAPAIELPTPATSEPRPVKLDKDQEAKKQKTKARMQVPSERTGRNLCVRHWLKQVNKDGTKSDFEEYWWTLTKEQRASYDTEVESIVRILFLEEYILMLSCSLQEKSGRNQPMQAENYTSLPGSKIAEPALQHILPPPRAITLVLPLSTRPSFRRFLIALYVLLSHCLSFYTVPQYVHTGTHAHSSAYQRMYILEQNRA